jgi:hypothetical protein
MGRNGEYLGFMPPRTGPIARRNLAQISRLTKRTWRISFTTVRPIAVEGLWNRIAALLDAFWPDECANYFRTPRSKWKML